MADFKRVIDDYFKKKNESVPQVRGSYNILNQDQFTISVNDRATRGAQSDKSVFLELYNLKPNDAGSQVGSGEVALFWLFGGMNDKVESTGGSFKPDLKISSNNIEVKAYDKPVVKIGRFQRQTEFLELVNTIFSVYNLANEKNEIFSVFSFNFESLTKAAEEFCLIRYSLNEAIQDLNTVDRQKFEKIKIFNGILRRAKMFDDFARKMGIDEICYLPNQKRPGGELIASTLLKFVTEKTLLEKPGGGSNENGFMAILPERQSTFSTSPEINFIKVISNGKINLKKDQIKNIPENVTFSSGAMHINFKKLFS